VDWVESERTEIVEKVIFPGLPKRAILPKAGPKSFVVNAYLRSLQRVRQRMKIFLQDAEGVGIIE
jgi:hypothetical protein